jgi:hypothetical protein
MASSRCTQMKVHISDNQKTKIKQAMEKGGPLTIRLLYEDLQGENTLAFISTQLTKLATAFNERKGITIMMSKMSRTRVEHKRKLKVDSFSHSLEL